MLGHIKIFHQPSSYNNSMGGSRTNTLAGRRSFKASLTTKIDSLIYHLLNKFSITLKFMRSSNRKNSVTSYFVLFFSNQNAFVAVECFHACLEGRKYFRHSYGLLPCDVISFYHQKPVGRKVIFRVMY